MKKLALIVMDLLVKGLLILIGIVIMSFLIYIMPYLLFSQTGVTHHVTYRKPHKILVINPIIMKNGGQSQWHSMKN